MSRDPASVDAYIRDPLCGFSLSNQSWVDLLDALGPLTDPHNLKRLPPDLPILAIAGTRDAVGDMGRGVLRLVHAYRSAGMSNVTLRLHADARHELFHETNRHEVYGEVVEWITSRLDGAVTA